MVDDIAKMKHHAILGNVGHFGDEIDMAGLARVPGIVRTEISHMCTSGRSRTVTR
jgi:adenosylhomocysteinase